MPARKAPTVTLNPSDSAAAQVVTAAQATITVTDEQNRQITLKRPPVLSQYRFVEALGETASNQAYMGMAMPLIFVTAIDGEPVALPTTKRQLEALIQRLDDHGVRAVMEGVQEHFAPKDKEGQEADVKK